MKLVLALHFAFMAVQTAASSLGRSLSEDSGEEQQEERQESGDKDDMMDDVVSQYQAQDQWSSYSSSRVGQDLQGMWTTTPEEWGDEYWEVLVSAAAIVFGVLLCFCLVCLAPCGSESDDSSKPLLVATKQEVNQRNLEKPILEEEDKAATTGNPANEGVMNSKNKRRRRTLWEEIAVVWGDFLTHGLTVNGDDENVRYNRAPSGRSSSRSRSTSRTRRQKSGAQLV